MMCRRIRFASHQDAPSHDTISTATTKMGSEFQVKRLPKPKYEGQNGFLEGPNDIVKNISTAVDQHRMAVYILENKKRKLPT